MNHLHRRRPLGQRLTDTAGTAVFAVVFFVAILADRKAVKR